MPTVSFVGNWVIQGPCQPPLPSQQPLPCHHRPKKKNTFISQQPLPCHHCPKKKTPSFLDSPFLVIIVRKKKTFMFHYLEGGRDLIDVFRMPSSQLYGLMRNIVASFQFHHCLAFPLFILISSRAEVARRFGLGRRRCRLACPRPLYPLPSPLSSTRARAPKMMTQTRHSLKRQSTLPRTASTT